MTDNERPPYYTVLEPEPIEVIEAWNLNFSLGSVVKYIARAGRKPNADAISDLVKARTYIDLEIQRREKMRS